MQVNRENGNWSVLRDWDCTNTRFCFGHFLGTLLTPTLTINPVLVVCFEGNFNICFYTPIIHVRKSMLKTWEKTVNYVTQIGSLLSFLRRQDIMARRHTGAILCAVWVREISSLQPSRQACKLPAGVQGAVSLPGDSPSFSWEISAARRKHGSHRADPHTCPAQQSLSRPTSWAPSWTLRSLSWLTSSL